MIELRWFRSLTYGFSTPNVVLWWAQFPDGALHIRAEQRRQYQAIAQLAKDMRSLTRDITETPIRYTVADQLQMDGKVRDTDGETRGQTFRAAGIPIRTIVHDPVQGWTRIRELLATPPARIRPWLTIDPSCESLIRALTNALSAKTDPESVETDDPALTALRLGAMSRPTIRPFAKPPLPKNAVGHLLNECLQGEVRNPYAWR